MCYFRYHIAWPSVIFVYFGIFNYTVNVLSNDCDLNYSSLSKFL